MIVFLVTSQHRYTIETFVDGWAPSLRKLIRVVPYERLGSAHTLPRGTYVFSDLERLSGANRRQAEETHARLADTGELPLVLNDPASSLVRFDLLQALKEGGANDFGPYRLRETRTPQRFPVFIREEGQHTGSLTALLNDQGEVDQAIARLYLQHGGLDKLLMIEFTDTSDGLGIFRKYGAFLVGSRIIPKHVFFSRGWMVKSHDLVETDQLREEEEFLETNPHEEQLRKVFQTAGISYGRIDYGIRNGRLQVWEINTNPMILGPRERVKQERLGFKLKLREEIARAFEMIDTPGWVPSEAAAFAPPSPDVAPPARAGLRVRASTIKRWARDHWFRAVDRMGPLVWRPVIALLKRTKWS